MKQDTAAIESLKAFALSQCVASCHPHDYANNDVYVRFANMCTAAVAGEGWAVERIHCTLKMIHIVNAVDGRSKATDALASRIIFDTDTTRPEVK